MKKTNLYLVKYNHVAYLEVGEIQVVASDIQEVISIVPDQLRKSQLENYVTALIHKGDLKNKRDLTIEQVNQFNRLIDFPIIHTVEFKGSVFVHISTIVRNPADEEPGKTWVAPT